MKNLLFLLGLLVPFTLFSQEKNGSSLKTIPADSTVYIKIEKGTGVDPMPEFPGGMRKMRLFISRNINYPQTAVRDSLKGIVLVQFVVLESGRIDQIEVLQSIREDLDNEAIRVIKKMPTWRPGLIKGRPVKVLYTIPFAFDF